eukprot:243662-Rhodomonas_salina.1
MSTSAPQSAFLLHRHQPSCRCSRDGTGSVTVPQSSKLLSLALLQPASLVPSSLLPSFLPLLHRHTPRCGSGHDEPGRCTLHHVTSTSQLPAPLTPCSLSS